MISNPAPQSRSSRRDGNHMALDNIRERLKATYGEAASLTSETVGGQYYVAIRLPVSGTAS